MPTSCTEFAVLSMKAMGLQISHFPRHASATRRLDRIEPLLKS
jgi:hypothetical protein